MKEHWPCTYRTPKHLVDFYQASIKEKGKEIEMNFSDRNGRDLTYYDGVDLLEDHSERTNYLMNDENSATE